MLQETIPDVDEQCESLMQNKCGRPNAASAVVIASTMGLLVCSVTPFCYRRLRVMLRGTMLDLAMKLVNSLLMKSLPSLSWNTLLDPVTSLIVHKHF